MKEKIFIGFLKTNHWLLLFSSIFLIFTGWLGLYVYTHANILPNLEFAYFVNEMQHGKASQLFISRVIRGMMWEWHWYIGLFFVAQMFIVALTAKSITVFKQNPFNLLFILIAIVLLITGYLRYYRTELSFMGEEDRFWRNLTRDIHRYSSYIFIILIFGHIGHVIYLNSKKYNRLISNMFTLNNFILRPSKKQNSMSNNNDTKNTIAYSLLFATMVGMTFSTISVHASTLSSTMKQPTLIGSTIVISRSIKDKNRTDPSYMEAMEFYSGKKGYWHEIREYPMCPYDACFENNDSVQTVEKDGMLQYKMKMHNFKDAKIHFDEAVAKNQNPLAAGKNLIMFMERLNYKDKYYDEILLAHTIESLGVKDTKQIKNEVKNNIQYIDETVECNILYKAGEIYEMGYFDIEPNKQRARELYTYASKSCEPNNLFFVLATNKLEFLREI